MEFKPPLHTHTRLLAAGKRSLLAMVEFRPNSGPSDLPYAYSPTSADEDFSKSGESIDQYSSLSSSPISDTLSGLKNPSDDDFIKEAGLEALLRVS
jgi:hypothetical protein